MSEQGKLKVRHMSHNLADGNILKTSLLELKKNKIKVARGLPKR